MTALMHPGTVARYDSLDRPDRWCRESLALADEDGVLFDTYWQSNGNAHRLTAAEVATARVLFNVNDYDELDQHRFESHTTWLKYHPDDRGLVTSQHGLLCRYFVRKGAQPHLETQIANAREAVEEAESRLSATEKTLKWRREELAALVAQRSTA